MQADCRPPCFRLPIMEWRKLVSTVLRKGGLFGGYGLAGSVLETSLSQISSSKRNSAQNSHARKLKNVNCGIY